MDLSSLPPEVAQQMAGLVTGQPQPGAEIPKLSGFTIETPQGITIEGDIDGAEIDLYVTGKEPAQLQLAIAMQLGVAEQMGAKVERRT